MSEAPLAQPEEPEAAEDFEERLLLVEREDREINQAVLQPMFVSGWKFWARRDRRLGALCLGLSHLLGYGNSRD